LDDAGTAEPKRKEIPKTNGMENAEQPTTDDPPKGDAVALGTKEDEKKQRSKLLAQRLSLCRKRARMKPLQAF